ncbi:MEDS domain-containing protein [Actinoplanes oblitus]|uniref:MEDS domain-containing protein n=1 Tax=Actinoplanes oblitus TaxID=3040509 RepID=A0ABY8WTK2_9ACTN|nr:ATP-binding protein [Actinoplanes oblitus]WIM99644.1 MEDS domain-containing protein [Actinoplanes oblitus]
MIVNHREPQGGETFPHSALLPGTDEELVSTLTAELRRSGDTYDEVLLVVSDRTRDLLSDAVHDLTGVLRRAGRAGFYQRLGFAYERFRQYLAEQASRGRRVYVIAEPDLRERPGDEPPPGRVRAYLAYESVCNDTYAPYGSAVTCVWDSRQHSAGVLDGVRATHRYLLTPQGRHRSPDFQPADDYLSDHGRAALHAVPAAVDHEQTLTEFTGLRELRAALSGWAVRHGFAADPADDLVVAVTEVATNGLRHAATPVRVRAWHHGRTLITQCDDNAGQPVPVTAGYHRPGGNRAVPGGRGLWLARQLADAVLLDTVPGRTSVRLHFPYHVMHR